VVNVWHRTGRRDPEEAAVAARAGVAVERFPSAIIGCVLARKKTPLIEMFSPRRRNGRGIFVNPKMPRKPACANFSRPPMSRDEVIKKEKP